MYLLATGSCKNHNLTVIIHIVELILVLERAIKQNKGTKHISTASNKTNSSWHIESLKWKKFTHPERILSVLFTKPYFQYHLKSSLSNLILEMFWYTHNIKSYCVPANSNKLLKSLG